MLVLTRQEGESIMIDNKIEIQFLKQLPKKKIKIGIQAPNDISVKRAEKVQNKRQQCE